MSRLSLISEQVLFELKKWPDLRDDDFLLISAVYCDFYGVGVMDSFIEIMENHRVLNLPSFESIRRTRQKIQEQHPALRSSKSKLKEKEKAFNEFYDYAKGYK